MASGDDSMPLREILVQIQDDLRRGRFTSEAAVSQGVVLPLLHELAWPVFDTHVVWPEFPIPDGRVDFALCHPRDRPVIFLEVKRVGQAEGADRQLFEYAFHQGVPMAVLTDGQEWHFYLPAEQGRYDERRVYKLDLLERTVPDSESRLKRYLGYPAVSAGSALNDARADYRDVNRERQVRDALPRAWGELLTAPDELLVELLAEKVEDLCGYRPTLEACSLFIRSGTRTSPTAVPSPSVPAALPRAPAATVPSSRQPAALAPIGYTLLGQFHPCSSAREVMAQVLQELDRRDPFFLERFITRKHGRRRRYVAQHRLELYPGRPDLAEDHYVELKPGWYAGTNYSRQVIESIIRLACDVASLSFGSDLQIQLGRADAI
jgi:predicted type IV restriction endonuclease